MRISPECLACNQTKPDCPLLTKATDNDDSPGCEYNNWAYALFAVVAFIIVGIPFVAFICYLQRRIQTKKRARGFTRSVSHDSSSPYPYQVWFKSCAQLYNTVNSLIATTSRKRPPPVSDPFVNNTFVSQSKYCSKSPLVSDHYSNFLSDHDQFLGQKFDIFFCFLFPVSDH